MVVLKLDSEGPAAIMVQMKLPSKILWLGVLLGALAAGAVAVSRLGWEGGYKQVALAVSLGDLYGIPGGIDELLKELKAHGLSALIISPQDVEELQKRFFPKFPSEQQISLEELERMRDLGLSIFWRLKLWVRQEKFAPYLEALFDLKPRGLIISSPFAPAPSHWDLILSGLTEHRALLGLVEFDRPAGVERLYHRGFRSFVRVHMMKREERSALEAEDALARLMRAALERNVRLLELRALTRDQILGDLEALGAKLRLSGFSLGGPPDPRPFAAGPWALVIVWLGLVSLSALALEKLVKLPSRQLAALWLGGVLVGSAGLFGLEPARVVAAWITAVAVPIAAFILLGKRSRQLKDLTLLAALSLSSTLGGLAAAAFLSQDLFFLGLEVFRGVKAALALPVLAACALAACGVERRLRALDLAIWAGAALLFVFALVRSGSSPLPVWGLEEQLRLRLEEFLHVRPRFKEFMVGHPLLVVWAGLGERRRRPWAPALLALGILGQVSIINSFLHLHTPVWVALVRTFHGLWLGAIFGLLLRLALPKRVD